MAEGFTSGFLGALQAYNAEAEQKLKKGKLDIDLQDLQLRQQQNAQKVQQEAYQRIMAQTDAAAQGYIEHIGTNFQEGTPVSEGLDRLKQARAQALKAAGMDPDLAEGWAQTVRAAMKQPKTQTAQPGTTILQVDTNGNVTPKYSVPALPSELQRSAEFAAGGNPEQARGLVRGVLEERAAGNQPRYSGQTPIYDSTGKQVAWVRASDKSAAPEYIDFNTGKPVQAQPDWTANTLSSQQQGSLSGQQVIELARTTLEEGQGIDAMVKMVGDAQSADQGYELVAQKFTGALKTFMDQRKNNKEFQAAIQSGNLAGALGGLRVPILGPGVMTQADKEFLVSAVGGDVNALRDPEVMAFHVGNLIQRKMQMYQLNRDQLANQAARFPKLGIKVPDEKKVDMSIFERKAAPQAAETYKDAASVTAAYQSKKITREQAAKILRDNGWAQ